VNPRIKNLLLIIITASFLAACGSNAKITKSFSDDSTDIIKQQKLELRSIKVSAKDVPDHFISAIKGHLKNELKKQGLLASIGNTQPASIDMDITYYRMRGGITRMMFGILAGKDGVEADIRISAHGSTEPLSELTASSYNVTALGERDDVARMFAEKIAKTIKESLNKSN